MLEIALMICMLPGKNSIPNRAGDLTNEQKFPGMNKK